MSADLEKAKDKPDSLISFDGKRLHEINALALTKFGNSFIHAKPDRDNSKFIVMVSNVNKNQKKEFETLWPMCKVLTVIE